MVVVKNQDWKTPEYVYICNALGIIFKQSSALSIPACLPFIQSSLLLDNVVSADAAVCMCGRDVELDGSPD